MGSIEDKRSPENALTPYLMGEMTFYIAVLPGVSQRFPAPSTVA